MGIVCLVPAILVAAFLAEAASLSGLADRICALHRCLAKPTKNHQPTADPQESSALRILKNLSRRLSYPATLFLKTPAVSTGLRTTGLKFTSWSFKAQSFSWALIELQRYLIEIGLGVAG